MLAASSEQSAVAIGKLVAKYGVHDIVFVSNGMEARRKLLERAFDLLVVNAPLSDEYGEALARDVSAGYRTQVLLLVRENTGEIAYKMEQCGVFTLERPINHIVFFNVLKMINAAHYKFVQVYEERERLKSRLEDMRLIGLAKCLLIEKLYYTEAAAHKQIEKIAMNERKSKLQVAREIIEKYRSLE